MKTPSDLKTPVFLLNFPLSVSNKYPNNDWMDPIKQGEYDLPKAFEQWSALYRYLAQNSIVYLLPGHGNLQDLPFVANLGCYLPHRERNTILLANFKSAPRRGEDVFGRKFFKSFDYEVWQPLNTWEGEADLKWVRSNLYIGCTGSRSSSFAYRWMRNNFEMAIAEIELSDPKLYHLDCVLFPLNEHKLIVNVEALRKQDVGQLERIAEIIPVPKDYIYQGWTNCVRLGRTLLHAPLDKPCKPFEDVLAKHDFGLQVFDLSEFDKSGADLSCLVMHLNYHNRF